jgi:hypothetical protein
MELIHESIDCDDTGSLRLERLKITYHLLRGNSFVTESGDLVIDGVTADFVDVAVAA